MKDAWYGDNRDLVKWSVAVYLARQRGLRHILQVACYRRDNRAEARLWGDGPGAPPEPTPLLPEVMRHFRDIHDIQRLAASAQIVIEVFDTEFKESRQVYFTAVCERLSRRARAGMTVLLDPDTGIAPRTFDWGHVRDTELRQVWDAMQAEDLLVFYQHRRRQKAWEEATRREFAAALGQEGRVALLKCPEVARDVVFFAAAK